MAPNRIIVPSSPTMIFLGFNIWLMNIETLFKRSGWLNILTFAINTLYQINEIGRITCKITSDVIFFTSSSINKCSYTDLAFKASCSYADLALMTFDNCASTYNCSPTTWKRFRDDVFVVWAHVSGALNFFLDYLNNLDDTGKIKFMMQVADETGLEFLDLKLKIV